MVSGDAAGIRLTPVCGKDLEAPVEGDVDNEQQNFPQCNPTIIVLEEGSEVSTQAVSNLKEIQVELGLESTQKDSNGFTFQDRSCELRLLTTMICIICTVIFVRTSIVTIYTRTKLYLQQQRMFSQAQAVPSFWIVYQMKTIPQTFGWRSLLLPLASLYDKPTDTATIAIIPLCHGLISAFTSYFTLRLLLATTEKYLDIVVLSLWIQMGMDMLLLVGSSSLWNFNRNELRSEMTTSMSLVSKPGAEFHRNMWNVTQVSGECCGIYGPLDWLEHSSAEWPASCFQPVVTGKGWVWVQGCYNKELEKLDKYEAVLIGILLIAIVSSITQLQFVTRRSAVMLRQYYAAQKLRQACLPKSEEQEEALSVERNDNCHQCLAAASSHVIDSDSVVVEDFLPDAVKSNADGRKSKIERGLKIVPTAPAQELGEGECC